MTLISLGAGFWKTDIISGSAINSLPTPVIRGFPLPLALYILAALVFLIITAFTIFKTRTRKAALVKSGAPLARAPRALTIALYSFMLVGFLLALRTEYTWLSVFSKDLRAFSGKSTDERIALVDATDYYPFMNFARAAIPSGESFRYFEIDPDKNPVNAQMFQLGRYYLLPTLISKEGRFIWVYNDPAVRFDFESERLDINGLSFKARPYDFFRRGAVIFEIMEDGY